MRKKTRNVEIVVFEGRKFTRYPDSDNRTDRLYFSAGGTRHKRLHVAIWESANGPVPKGMHVHHMDGNQLNNALENLACLTVAEHSRADVALGAHRTERKRAHLEKIQPLTREWHSSPEGLAWHSEHGKDTWKDRQPVERVCEHCGKTYSCMTNRGSERFCSRNCTTKARKATGVDNEERICGFCSKVFSANKYSRIRFCSLSCSARNRCGWPKPDEES